MSPAKTFTLLLAAAAMATLTGCSSFPTAIAVPEPEQLPAFVSIQGDTGHYQGQTVVLGGAIVSVTNEANRSVVEVLQLPLYGSGRPHGDTDKSAGRFRVSFDQFLDPQVYSNGRMLTVRGTVSGSEEGSIGEYPYRFITLRGNGLYLWPDQADEVQVRYYMGINTYYPYPVYVRPRPPKP